jgi:hypothetical protein
MSRAGGNQGCGQSQSIGKFAHDDSFERKSVSEPAQSYTQLSRNWIRRIQKNHARDGDADMASAERK